MWGYVGNDLSMLEMAELYWKRRTYVGNDVDMKEKISICEKFLRYNGKRLKYVGNGLVK